MHLILAGWFPNPEAEAAFRDAAAQLCPQVSLHVVDARDPDTGSGSAIWFAGDVFCSLSDTIQETFGLTPVEAMASGLPAIVTDWNGYRDTIEPGITGFLIPTRTPIAGAGAVIAEAAEDGRLSEDTVHGVTGLLTAFDIGACAQAIARLAGDAALRRGMAAAALARAPTYDWTAVLAAYRDLFASYPSARLGPGTWLALRETWHEDRGRLASLRGAMFLAPIVSFDATAESILAALAAGPMTAGVLARPPTHPTLPISTAAWDGSRSWVSSSPATRRRLSQPPGRRDQGNDRHSRRGRACG